jgi:intergrase/recombinase
MTTRTPEEYRRWLIEQTQNCLTQAKQKIDAKMATALDKAAQDYMAELNRLIANKKNASNSRED